MGVCRQTVDKHRDNLYRKIGCTSVVEAALLAVAYGVISVAPMGPLVVRRTKAVRKGAVQVASPYNQNTPPELPPVAG